MNMTSVETSPTYLLDTIEGVVTNGLSFGNLRGEGRYAERAGKVTEPVEDNFLLHAHLGLLLVNTLYQDMYTTVYRSPASSRSALGQSYINHIVELYGRNGEDLPDLYNRIRTEVIYTDTIVKLNLGGKVNISIQADSFPEALGRLLEDFPTFLATTIEKFKAIEESQKAPQG